MYQSARPSGLKISICTASVPIITRNYSTSEFSAFCISGLTRTFSEEKVKIVTFEASNSSLSFSIINLNKYSTFCIVKVCILHLPQQVLVIFFFHQVNIGLALALLRGLTKDDVRTGAWEEKKVIKFSLFHVHNFHGCYHSRRRQIEN